MSKVYAPKLKTTRGLSVPINNLEIYYEEYGVGKPLLLLHGFGGCSQNWHPFIDSLSERYHSALWIIPGGDHVPIFDSSVPFTSTALLFLGS